MNRLQKTHWMIAGLAALAGALAALLVVEYQHNEGPRIAFGQEGAVGANYVLAMLGPTVNDATPVVLIDTKSETVMIYDYMVSRKMFLLRSVRKYTFDKELMEANFWNGDSYSYPGQRVGDVQNMLRMRR